MNVYWLEQTQVEVPQENDWLSASETACLSNMRIPKRGMDWRLGRWTAKRALAAWLHVPAHPLVFAKIEIRPAPTGAPEVFLANKPANVSISLSHRDDRAMCALALSGAELGCDLEMIEPHSDAFLADYFTAQEQALVAGTSAADRPRMLALLWSSKESTLKALHTGLRVDTRCAVVSQVDPFVDRHGWSPLQVLYTDNRVFHGWWQRTESRLRTLVAHPRPEPPIPIRVPAYCSERVTQFA